MPASLLLVLVLLFLPGCSKEEPPSRSVAPPLAADPDPGAPPVNSNPMLPLRIYDEANLLSNHLEEHLTETYRFPSGVLMLVRTIDELDYATIGSYATDAMEKETYWAKFGREGEPRPWSMGVYILVSKRPSLIQLRYGEMLRWQAYRAGLVIGNKYQKIQQEFEQRGPNLGTLNTVKVLSQELPVALDLPWYLQYAKPLIAITFAELQELASPPTGTYSKWILRPYLVVIDALGAEGAFGFFLSSILLYMLIQVLASRVLVEIILLRKGSDVKVRWRKRASLAISVLFAVPFLAGGVLLSSGRLEDHLALQGLGITDPERFALGLSWFMDATGFWLGALATLLNYINRRIENPVRKTGSIIVRGGDPIEWSHALPGCPGQWSFQQIGERTWHGVFTEYVCRPRFAMLICIMFVPAGIAVVVIMKELVGLVDNLIA
jgi:hypothetical protein